MSNPANREIRVGKPHRTRRELKVMIRDYETLSVKIATLPEGTLFQPWTPLQAHFGADIPITLGEGAREFDWGSTSQRGHFLTCEDFFSGCQIVESESAAELDPRLKSAVRCWKLSGGQYLLQGAPEPWPTRSPASVRLFNGQVIKSASEFYVVDSRGHITRTYPVPRLYGLHDTLYIADIYAVVDEHLCCYLWQQAGPNDAVGDTVSVYLAPVADCSLSDLPFGS
jgi:hypothetical protein